MFGSQKVEGFVGLGFEGVRVWEFQGSGFWGCRFGVVRDWG